MLITTQTHEDAEHKKRGKYYRPYSMNRTGHLSLCRWTVTKLQYATKADGILLHYNSSRER